MENCCADKHNSKPIPAANCPTEHVPGPSSRPPLVPTFRCLRSPTPDPVCCTPGSPLWGNRTSIHVRSRVQFSTPRTQPANHSAGSRRPCCRSFLIGTAGNSGDCPTGGTGVWRGAAAVARPVRQRGGRARAAQGPRRGGIYLLLGAGCCRIGLSVTSTRCVICVITLTSVAAGSAQGLHRTLTREKGKRSENSHFYIVFQNDCFVFSTETFLLPNPVWSVSHFPCTI